LENHQCPHLAYAKVSEREVAQFPPLRLIIKDRLGIWREDIYWKLRWWFWDSLWFNRQKTKEFLDSIKSISSKDCPTLKEFEDDNIENQKLFVEWFGRRGDK